MGQVYFYSSKYKYLNFSTSTVAVAGNYFSTSTVAVAGNYFSTSTVAVAGNYFSTSTVAVAGNYFSTIKYSVHVLECMHVPKYLTQLAQPAGLGSWP